MNRLKDKLTAIIPCVLLTGVIMTGCNGKTNNDISEITSEVIESNVDMIYGYQDFDTILDDANLIVTGTVYSLEEKGTCLNINIKVDEVIKGKCTDKELLVKKNTGEYSAYIDGEEIIGYNTNSYEKGKQYIFVTEHIKNVYRDDYYISSETYLPTDNPDKCSVLGRSIKDEIKENPLEYVKQYEYKDEGVDSVDDYIESDNLEDIIHGSPYVVKVKIKRLNWSNGEQNGYYCSVLDDYGSDMEVDSEGDIEVPIQNKIVEEGDEVILCLERSTGMKYVYFLTSENSVIDAQRENEVKEIMGK